MKLSYTIAALQPYINWAYFFHAWQVNEPAEKERLRQEAERFLDDHSQHYQAHALFQLFDANSDGDDIILDGTIRLPMLRQQHPSSPDSPNLCLADFLRPLSLGHDRIGLFATSVDHAMETDFNDDSFQKMMAQLLADRLAEAAAERMHEEVRRHYWGYAPDEQLSVEALFAEHFQGIRPAVGYPSLPDTSLNFLLDQLLSFQQIGIRLTESGAMQPHASVSGLMLAHPEARYFSLGKIGEDQLRDYALRRGLPVEMMRRFLAGNLR